jgi:hypothetical protein
MGDSASSCGACHPRQLAQWSQSVMGHAAVSPMFNALELLIEEQVERRDSCPDGAGILRRASPGESCVEPSTGHTVTGSGGAHWCVNCHAPAENLRPQLPPWSRLRPSSRRPVRELLSPLAREGITCVVCHQMRHPDLASTRAGNPSWRSFVTGISYPARPEDAFGLLGIANSGYQLDASELIDDRSGRAEASRGARANPRKIAAHLRPRPETARHLRSSEMCGACHDVRLFGSDVLGARRGESFKRLRNAYSEWRAWSQAEQLAGRPPASCQDCHMSEFPGVCLPDRGASASAMCPPGTRFEPRDPGDRAVGLVANDSSVLKPVAAHYFTSVDLPMLDVSSAASSQRAGRFDLPGTDASGTPLSARMRRHALVARALRLVIGEARRERGRLRLPIIVENVGAGHRVPAGFSQEREIWVHLQVEDADGRLIYEVGRTDRDDEDLRDKIFVRINTNPDARDGQGRPIGLFGADVADGPDKPEWRRAGAADDWLGRGLINLQNGFLRCVSCRREPIAGQCLGAPGELRAARFVDGQYDLDSGRCVSNLSLPASLFEVYFPVGALDARRGVVKGADAIIDTRSLAPGQPRRYIYQLSTGTAVAPFTVRARLMFRSLPPFLVRAFAAYEAAQAARGRRPRGALVRADMALQLERVEIASQTLVVP